MFGFVKRIGSEIGFEYLAICCIERVGLSPFKRSGRCAVAYRPYVSSNWCLVFLGGISVRLYEVEAGEHVCGGLYARCETVAERIHPGAGCAVQSPPKTTL